MTSLSVIMFGRPHPVPAARRGQTIGNTGYGRPVFGDFARNSLCAGSGAARACYAAGNGDVMAQVFPASGPAAVSVIGPRHRVLARPADPVWQAGRMARARLDKRPREVSAMFDLVAERYDLLNDVLSAGQDRRWRSAVAAALRAGPGERVLDLAAGTGTVSRVLAGAGASCVACDFSLGMLRVGASRLGRGSDPGAVRGPGAVRFVAGDALALPLRDGAFDAVTISFGLRNVADPAAALATALRQRRSWPADSTSLSRS